MRIVLAMGVLSVLAGFAVPASAAGDGDAYVERTVSASGLDLNREADRHTLRQRIFTAAGEVCAEVGNGLAPSGASYDSCVQRVYHETTPQVQVVMTAMGGTILVASAGR